MADNEEDAIVVCCYDNRPRRTSSVNFGSNPGCKEVWSFGQDRGNGIWTLLSTGVLMSRASSSLVILLSIGRTHSLTQTWDESPQAFKTGRHVVR